MATTWPQIMVNADAFTTEVRVEEVTCLDDRYELLQKIHTIYVDRGYMEPVPLGMRIRKCDIDKNTIFFQAIIADKICGCISLVTSPDLYPSLEYTDIIDTLPPSVEITNLATWVPNSRKRLAAMINLERALYQFCLKNELDMFSLIGENHENYYHQMFGFKRILDKIIINDQTNDEVIGIYNPIDNATKHMAKVNVGEFNLLKWFES